jgi:hypothetical protein
MPSLSALLASTVSAIEAYEAWVTSLNGPSDRTRLVETIQAADDALGSTLALAQQRWAADPAQWLTFGTVLAMTQRILAEVSPPDDE